MSDTQAPQHGFQTGQQSSTKPFMNNEVQTNQKGGVEGKGAAPVRLSSEAITTVNHLIGEQTEAAVGSLTKLRTAHPALADEIDVEIDAIRTRATQLSKAVSPETV